jgi:SHS2 domain-containing protein
MRYPSAAERRQKVTYYYLPHTADLRVAFEAPTFAALLEDVVRVIREQTAGDRSVEARAGRGLALEAPDLAELFFSFAREALAAFQVDRFVPAGFELHALALPPARPSVAGRLWGEPFDPARHEVQPEIKAVTRHGLKLEEGPGAWRAELLFDV